MNGVQQHWNLATTTEAKHYMPNKIGNSPSISQRKSELSTKVDSLKVYPHSGDMPNCKKQERNIAQTVTQQSVAWNRTKK
eukprot:927054-Amphidinium_carterae.1